MVLFLSFFIFLFNHVEVQSLYILQSDFRGFLFQRILRSLCPFPFFSFLATKRDFNVIPVIMCVYIYFEIHALCCFWDVRDQKVGCLST